MKKPIIFCSPILKDKIVSILKPSYIVKNKSVVTEVPIIAISSFDDYNKLSYKKKDIGFDDVFVEVELAWYSNNKIHQGYDLAIELINEKLKGSFVQLRFFSLEKQAVLMSEVTGNKRFMASAFQHFHLLTNDHAALVEYSNEHFEFLKHLALKKSGVLLFVKHELSKILRELDKTQESFTKQKQEIKNLLKMADFVRNELKIDNEFNFELADKVQISIFLNQLLFNIDLVIAQIDDKPKHQKLPYKVLIVEDDKSMLTTLVDIFSNHFAFIYPKKEDIEKYSIHKAKYELENSKGTYHVMITDILFQKQDMSLELLSGIDFMHIIRNKFKYMATRVVTNTSRQILGQILNLPIQNLYPKNMGLEALKEFIVNDIVRIASECMENEERKKTGSIGPKIGYFRNLEVQMFIEELMLTGTFDSFWEQNSFEKYKEFKTTGSIKDFNLELMKENKKNLVPEIIKKKLSTIFTYRLLFFDFYKYYNEHGSVYLDLFESNYLSKLGKNLEKFDVEAFLTRIGIGYERSKGKVKLENLLPQEINFFLKETNPVNIFINSEILAQWCVAIQKPLKLIAIDKKIVGEKYSVNLSVLNKVLEDVINSNHKEQPNVCNQLNDLLTVYGISPDSYNESLKSIASKMELIVEVALNFND